MMSEQAPVMYTEEDVNHCFAFLEHALLNIDHLPGGDNFDYEKINLGKRDLERIFASIND